MQSIVDNAPKEALDRAGVRLIVIGNGSPHMAKAYKGELNSYLSRSCSCIHHDFPHQTTSSILLTISSSTQAEPYTVPWA